MSTQTGREEFGFTSVGLVVVVTFEGSPDENGDFTEQDFQVRHGVHTVGSLGSLHDAQVCARAVARAH